MCGRFYGNLQCTETSGREVVMRGRASDFGIMFQNIEFYNLPVERPVFTEALHVPASTAHRNIFSLPGATGALCVERSWLGK